LTFRDGRIRKEFSYTPLALYLLRARAHATASAQPICYVSQDGIDITIAPRLAFTFYLDSNLRFLSNPQQRKLDRSLWTPFKRSLDYLQLKQPLRYSSLLLKDGGSAAESQKIHDRSVWRERDFSLFMTQSDHKGRLFQKMLEEQRIVTNQVHDKSLRASRNILAIWKQWITTNRVYDRPCDRFRITSYPVNCATVFRKLFELSQGRVFLSPVPESHMEEQLIAGTADREWRLRKPKRLFGMASTANYPILANKLDFVANQINKVETHPATSFAQRNIGKLKSPIVRKLNKSFSKEDSHFAKSFSSSVSTFRDAKSLDTGSENMDFHKPDRQSARQSKSKDSQERLISPAQLSYRTEKKRSLAAADSVAQPTPLPINAPKIDIDRLSRDVWNKIEKRIRIERERHGRL
jgi:hypothetical protein